MATLNDKLIKINEDFDKKEAALKEERENEITKAIVNDFVDRIPSMSMGNIITIFENISTDVLKTKGGKKMVNGFVKIVKEDRNIQNSFLLKEHMKNNVGIENPKEFINEAISIAKETSDANGFKESKKKLSNFVSCAVKALRPSVVREKIKIDENIERMNDNIETLMWGKKTIKNAVARITSINEAVDFLSNQSNSESKEDVFENCKNECIKSIDEAWKVSEGSVRLKLTEMKDKLSKKTYSELTADEDIKYMKELIETIR